jgi:DNA replication protein DnaC
MNTTTAIELNNKFEEFKQYKIISIDDLGTESVANDFETRRNFVQELIDEAERKQKLLILSTNLNEKELTEKYDIRTMDRLRSLTKVVIFSGQSLRK